MLLGDWLSLRLRWQTHIPCSQVCLLLYQVPIVKQMVVIFNLFNRYRYIISRQNIRWEFQSISTCHKKLQLGTTPKIFLCDLLCPKIQVLKSQITVDKVASVWGGKISQSVLSCDKMHVKIKALFLTLETVVKHTCSMLSHVSTPNMTGTPIKKQELWWHFINSTVMDCFPS